MNKSQAMMLELVKYEIFDKLDVEPSEFSMVEWDDIYKEAQNHKMTSFVFNGLHKFKKNYPNIELKIEEKLFQTWKMNAFSIVLRYYEIQKQQNEVILALKKEGIPYCILKGSSVSVYYPKPEYRIMGDIDVYVEQMNFEKVSCMLKELGYKYDNTTTVYHSSFFKNGFELELHNSFAGLPVGKTRTNLYFLKDVCSRGIIEKCNIGEFVAPCPMDNGIIQLLHLIHHISEGGMDLRHLYDWMFFVSHNLKDDVWKNEIESLYKKIHLDQFAKLLTKVCQKYLGLNDSNITWHMDADDKKCEEFMTYIWDKEELDRIKMEKRKVGNSEILVEKMPEDLWEYQRETCVNYNVQLFFRTMKKMINGEKNILAVKERWLYIRTMRKKFVRLGIFSYKNSKDYSML